MTDRLTQSELETYLWGAAIILRGLVDAGDYKQYIFPLLFYTPRGHKLRFLQSKYPQFMPAFGIQAPLRCMGRGVCRRVCRDPG